MYTTREITDIVTARNYATGKAKTLHSCTDPETCTTPDRWQDHCHIYHSIIATQNNREAIAELLDPYLQRILVAYQRSNPTMSPEQASALNKLATKASSAWVGRIAAGAEDPYTPWVITRIQETVSEPVANITPPLMKTLTPKCRHVRCQAPRGWEVPCRVHTLATQTREHEALLVTYYQGRLREVQSKATRRIVLTSMERAELGSYANEAFLSLVRSYNTEKLAPFQGYLREYMHKRIEDIILSSKPMARPLRDFDLATKRHLENNPNLKTRHTAALDLGIAPSRIHDLETVRGIVSNSSLDHLLDGDENSVGGYEKNLTPINTSQSTNKAEPEGPMQMALDAVLEQLDQEQIDLYRAHIDGSLPAYLKEVGMGNKDTRAAKNKASTLSQQIIQRAQELLDDIVEKGESYHDPELSSLNVPKLIEDSLRNMRPSDLARLHYTGGLKGWAESRDLPVREVFRISDSILSQYRHARVG